MTRFLFINNLGNHVLRNKYWKSTGLWYFGEFYSVFLSLFLKPAQRHNHILIWKEKEEFKKPSCPVEGYGTVPFQPKHNKTTSGLTCTHVVLNLYCVWMWKVRYRISQTLTFPFYEILKGITCLLITGRTVVFIQFPSQKKICT